MRYFSASSLVLVLCLVLTASAQDRQETAAGFRLVGYLPDYRAADFDPAAARGLTDLIVFSAQPDKDGGLNRDRLKRVPWARLREFKTRERVRLLLCVGGWGRSTHFPAVAASDETRRAFVQVAVRACLDERLDGIDLDWEHPRNGQEEAGYAALLAACREGFRPHGLVLSVTLAAWQKLPREAFGSVDAVQIMSYDHKGRHATFEAAQADVKALLAQGAPAGKLVLGLPFYGRPIAGGRDALTYRQILARYRPAPDADEVEGVFWNGPATIRRKTQFALESGLGGVMVWELGQDAAGKESLLEAIHEAVRTFRKGP
jgi:GH18 family chitinase